MFEVVTVQYNTIPSLCIRIEVQVFHIHESMILRAIGLGKADAKWTNESGSELSLLRYLQRHEGVTHISPYTTLTHKWWCTDQKGISCDVR